LKKSHGLLGSRLWRILTAYLLVYTPPGPLAYNNQLRTLVASECYHMAWPSLCCEQHGCTCAAEYREVP